MLINIKQIAIQKKHIVICLDDISKLSIFVL